MPLYDGKYYENVNGGGKSLSNNDIIIFFFCE